jgi:hypothetical protein
MAKNKKKTPKRTKLLKAEYTGKLRPHKHTSYGSLLVILLFAFVPLTLVSRSASADSSYKTYAVVVAPVPKNPPVITNMTNGKVFSTSDPITISGTCPNNSLVKIFKNEVMVGATLCKGSIFQLQIDLFEGSNSLIARAYNANDIPAPDSTPVSVILQLPGINTGGTLLPGTNSIPAGQFYITTDVFYQGANAGDTMSWPITIAGGQSPYAVSVGWGDGKTDLISQGAAGKFNISHIYTQPAKNGSYTILINATDQNGNKSFLQLVAIVGGVKTSSSVFGSISGGHNGLMSLKTAWQAMGVIGIVIISFWIGERREIYALNRRPGHLS